MAKPLPAAANVPELGIALSVRLAKANGTRIATRAIVADPIPRTAYVAPPKADTSIGVTWLAKNV
jgi:hypothetical protein